MNKFCLGTLNLFIFIILTVCSSQVKSNTFFYISDSIVSEEVIEYEYDTVVSTPDTLKFVDTVIVKKKKLKENIPYFIEFNSAPSLTNFFSTPDFPDSGVNYINAQNINWSLGFNVGTIYKNWIFKAGISYLYASEEIFRQKIETIDDSMTINNEIVYFTRDIINRGNGQNYFYYFGTSVAIGYRYSFRRFELQPFVALQTLFKLNSNFISIDEDINPKPLDRAMINNPLVTIRLEPSIQYKINSIARLSISPFLSFKIYKLKYVPSLLNKSVGISLSYSVLIQ